MSNIKKGDSVRQKMPEPIQGAVIEKAFDDDLNAFKFRVEYSENGDIHHKWFFENELEAM
jgi:hypothetical protein